MPEVAWYAVYLVVKYLAYALWCYAGIRWLAPATPRPISRDALLGLGRLVLGIGIGIFIFFAALSMNNATRSAPLTYMAVYVPVRVVEWLLWHGLVAGRPRDARSVLWILGGVVVSCAADAPLGIMEGGIVPVGRPFC